MSLAPLWYIIFVVTLIKVVEYLDKKRFRIYMLRALHETFEDFIRVVMEHDCRGYIGEIWSQYGNVYRNDETFIANIRLVED